jgi:hypothetical protein
LALISGWRLIGVTHRGQQWTPVLMLPHMRYGLSALLMEVFCTFCRPSRCRHVHRAFMRNDVLDLTTIVRATTCRQRNYVGTYGRFITPYCIFISTLMHNRSFPHVPLGLDSTGDTLNTCSGCIARLQEVLCRYPCVLRRRSSNASHD